MQEILPTKKNLGGFYVRRLLPSSKIKMIGPWIFFDHLGPANFEPGNGLNVRPHPHINLATVTYLFEGEVMHKDSLGNEQLIKAGDLNLMIAGKGITHSEREREEFKKTSHTQHALQLWLALPEEFEEMQAEFHSYSEKDIPALKDELKNIKIIIGEAYGEKSPVKTLSKTLYIEADIKSDAKLKIPSEEDLAIYVVEGSINANYKIINKHQMLYLKKDELYEIKAEKNCKIIIIGGNRLTERYLDWNFVSSSKRRIEKAKQDWKNGNFPLVPGDEEDFIPLPEKK